MKKKTTIPLQPGAISESVMAEADALGLLKPAASVKDVIPPIVEQKIKSKGVQNLLAAKVAEAEAVALIQVELKSRLTELCELVEQLDSAGIKNALFDTKYSEYCQRLGISAQSELPLAVVAIEKEATKRTNKRSGKFTGDDVLKFIGEEEKSKSEIIKHFDCSPITLDKRLTELGDKVSSRKDGVKVMLKAVKK